jgi:lipopolysaccharide export LptBFGC system permease protein LptF
MNRIILILLLIGIGICVYYYIVKSGYYNDSLSNVKKMHNKDYNNNRHVHFAQKEIILGDNDDNKSYNEINENINRVSYDIPVNKSFNQNTNFINTDTYIDDIFIKPIEISNTNLTLSENEYFNN